MNSFAHTDLLAAAFAGVLQKHPSLFHPRGKLACKQSALYRLPSVADWHDIASRGVDLHALLAEAPDLKRQCVEDGCEWLAVRSTEKVLDVRLRLLPQSNLAMPQEARREELPSELTQEDEVKHKSRQSGSFNGSHVHESTA
eukprot:symbB.v1.2.009928.t1/scaffold640.1/size177612/11